MTSKANMEDPATAEAKSAVSGPGFRFPLPFDPVRILSGVAARWPLIVLFSGMGLAAGIAAGITLTRPSFTVSASLIKRKVPQNVQTSETGQPYRPADLNDPTLLATLLAAEPLEKAVSRHDKKLEARAMRKQVEASQQKGTDIYFITYHSTRSPEDAIKFTRVWAEEITEYTKRLQQSDARGVRAILQSEVAEMEKRLAAINQRILDFSREKQFLGTDTQVTAALNQLGQTSLELENARASLRAKDSQIEALENELRRQSPIDSQLKTAHEEVAALRSTYTDENPLVKAKLQGIAYLEQKLREAQAGGPSSLDAYTGTPIGNQLFLDILSLRNERTEFAGKVDSYTAMLKSTEERIKEYPAIVSVYQDLEKQRETTIASLTLLSNRLKETEIFASSAPGYWQIFEGPEDHDITPASKVKLPLVFGSAGALAGGGSALLLILLLTSRAGRRSALECCALSQAPLLLDYYPEKVWNEDFDRLWITAISPRMRGGSLLAWTAYALAEDERSFWIELAEAARRDDIALPTVVDLSPDGLWDGRTLPAGLRWSAAAPSGTVIYRASRLPSADGREKIAHLSWHFTLVSGTEETHRLKTRTRGMTAGQLPPCYGTVAILSHPSNRIRRFGDRVSRLLAKRLSQPLPTPAPTDHD